MGRPRQIEGIIAKGNLVPLVFHQNAVAASQTDVQLKLVETAATSSDTDNDEYVMPFDGEIVAISAELSAAATAGTLTIGPTVDGTEKTDPTLSITTATEAWDTCLRDTVPFLAGDRIGAEITTGATWDATTADLAVVVWVLLSLEGI